MFIALSKDETYDIVASLRFEALVTEVNRRRKGHDGSFVLVGQPFVSGQYICQAIVTAPHSTEGFK